MRSMATYSKREDTITGGVHSQDVSNRQSQGDITEFDQAGILDTQAATKPSSKNVKHRPDKSRNSKKLAHLTDAEKRVLQKRKLASDQSRKLQDRRQRSVNLHTRNYKIMYLSGRSNGHANG